MPDILQDLLIKALLDRVFETISTPRGLDRWWTKTCVVEPPGRPHLAPAVHA